MSCREPIQQNICSFYCILINMHARCRISNVNTNSKLWMSPDVHIIYATPKIWLIIDLRACACTHTHCQTWGLQKVQVVIFANQNIICLLVINAAVQFSSCEYFTPCKQINCIIMKWASIFHVYQSLQFALHVLSNESWL